MDYIYKNIKKYNPNKKRKILVPFDNMIADLLSKKKINAIVTGLFLKGRKINISLVFITQSYLMLPKLLEEIQHIILLGKFQTKENFKKLHSIIHQILIFEDF